MKRPHRVAAFLLPVAVALSACNAILGIGELTPPERADAGNGAPDGSGDSAGSPVTDGGGADDGDGEVALPLCADQPDADPCLVVIAQTAETIYPTWRLTSYNNRPSIGVAVVPPILPVYEDAGDGTVIEKHSQLTWQTRLAADGGAVAFEDGKNACAALGPDWRLPSRVELGSLHMRDYNKGPTYANCMPSAFEVAPPPKFTWTSTEMRDVGLRYVGYEEQTCGSNPVTPSTALVRCVKGQHKDATFVVRKSADLVWARETNLDWERTGTIVKSYDDAKAHCDARNARVPIVEEATSIIDTRLASIFDSKLFVAPDGGMRAIVTATHIFTDGDGHLTHYECLATLPETIASVDAVEVEPSDPTPKLLVRCVKEHTD